MRGFASLLALLAASTLFGEEQGPWKPQQACLHCRDAHCKLDLALQAPTPCWRIERGQVIAGKTLRIRLWLVDDAAVHQRFCAQRLHTLHWQARWKGKAPSRTALELVIGKEHLRFALRPACGASGAGSAASAAAP